MEAIGVKNVVKRFGNHKVLNDVSISFKKGTITGIVGHNGSGKTVLFKCICGFYGVDSGEIVVNENRVMGEGEVLREAGIIIENPAFIEKYSGIKNLSMLYEINHKKDREYIRSIMKSVGLNPDNKKRVATYSMGMKQRLAIAQAIMENRDILILDEPMNGLDTHGVEYFRRLFLELKKKGKTLILASHNKEDIDLLCDEVYYMENGIISEYLGLLKSGKE